MKTKALVSIVVPTYNRSKSIHSLLKWLIAQSYVLNGLGIEVIFSENHSTDDTRNILEDFVARGLIRSCKIVSPPTHLPSGELNMFWALQHCASTLYAWCLADDDLPSKSLITEVYKTLLSRKYAAVFVNAVLEDDCGSSFKYPSGSVFSAKDAFIGFNQSVEASIFSIAGTLGLIDLFASFSTVIFRRTDFLRSACNYITPGALSIYGHVFTLLEAFASHPCCFLGGSFVSLGRHADGQHWQIFAELHNLPPRWVWHTGLIAKVLVFKARNPLYSLSIDMLLQVGINRFAKSRVNPSKRMLLPTLALEALKDLKEAIATSAEALELLLGNSFLEAYDYVFSLLNFSDVTLRIPFRRLRRSLVLPLQHGLCVGTSPRPFSYGDDLDRCIEICSVLSADLLPKHCPSWALASYPLIKLCTLSSAITQDLLVATEFNRISGGLYQPVPFVVGSQSAVVNKSAFGYVDAYRLVQSMSDSISNRNLFLSEG
jgi:hypothetical protein